MRVVGIKQLKARLSEYLRDVRRGEVFLVTDRDEVVAELRPATASAARVLDELRADRNERSLATSSTSRQKLHSPALLEAALYGPDLGALERFYTEVLGLPVILRATGRLVALRAGNTALLLFDPAVTREPGVVPEHGTIGAGHVAFVIEDRDRDEWQRRLEANDVAIEKEVTWPEGGVSLYVRDPAGNSVELAPPRIWGGLGRELLDAM